MNRKSYALLAPLVTVGWLAAAAGPGCGKSPPPLFTGDTLPTPSEVSGDAASQVPVLSSGCVGFQCSVPDCEGGATSVSGTVYDPAGNVPLYNVVVYVPGSPPGPITTGASCDSCSALYTGGAVAAAITDAKGQFHLQGVPAGNSIPLVVQIGKWRRQTSIATVTPCQDNPYPTKLTLPANHSEGDIPNIAISTGGADSLECLLLRIGIEASEYTAGAGGAGRIHIFQGSTAPVDPYTAATTSPAAPLSSEALWNSLANLMPYDITMLSCEGAETVDEPGAKALTASDQQNLFDYTSAGGRVFASHFHYAWFNTGPFAAFNIASWSRGANSITDSSNNGPSGTTQDFIYADILTTFEDGGPFPKGIVLQQWLNNVGALNLPGQQAVDELQIQGAKHNADLAGLAGTPSQGWIAADQNAQTYIEPGATGDAAVPVSAAGAIEYLSFNTPFDAGLDDAGDPQYCGRVVYSDLHVGAASGDYNGKGAGGIVPSGCAMNPLSPQEKALEFMLFDLSSCVTPDTGTGTQPVPGPIK